MDRPASHHGTERPEAKNSDMFLLPRLPKKSAGTKQIKSDNAMMSQSMPSQPTNVTSSGTRSCRSHRPR